MRPFTASPLLLAALVAGSPLAIEQEYPSEETTLYARSFTVTAYSTTTYQTTTYSTTSSSTPTTPANTCTPPPGPPPISFTATAGLPDVIGIDPPSATNPTETSFLQWAKADWGVSSDNLSVQGAYTVELASTGRVAFSTDFARDLYYRFQYGVACGLFDAAGKLWMVTHAGAVGPLGTGPPPWRTTPFETVVVREEVREGWGGLWQGKRMLACAGAVTECVDNGVLRGLEAEVFWELNRTVGLPQEITGYTLLFDEFRDDVVQSD